MTILPILLGVALLVGVFLGVLAKMPPKQIIAQSAAMCAAAAVFWGLSLMVLHDAFSGGGTANTQFDLTGDTASYLVRDDDPGNDSYPADGPNQFIAEHLWVNPRTDGVAIGVEGAGGDRAEQRQRNHVVCAQFPDEVLEPLQRWLHRRRNRWLAGFRFHHVRASPGGGDQVALSVAEPIIAAFPLYFYLICWRTSIIEFDNISNGAAPRADDGSDWSHPRRTWQATTDTSPPCGNPVAPVAAGRL